MLIICCRMRSVCLLFVAVCAVCDYYLLLLAQYSLTKYKISGTVLSCTALTLTICYRLPQYTLIICYHMRSVRLLFATVCAVYANKANHSLILSFGLNQDKTYEISKKSKKNYYDTFR
jgi:hypothetical protein